MELLVIFAVVVLAWLALMFIGFLNLKAKFMSALGLYGIDYETANLIYTQNITSINAMFRDGRSADDIAATLVNEVTSGNTTAEWVDYVLDIFSGQIADISVLSDHLDKKLERTLLVSENFVIECQQNDFAIDYFSGFISGLLVRAGALDINERIVIGATVFIRLFGDDVGELMYRRGIERSVTRREFTGEGLGAGAERGIDDAVDYIESGKPFNFRWIK